MKRFVPRIGALTALLFVIGFVGAVPVGAAQTDDTARITIHNRICPEGFSGPDYYGACHDTAPNPGLPFSLSGPESASDTTDSSGNVTFASLTPGDYAVSGGVPGEFADVNYFCAEADALTIAYPFTETTTGITVSLPAGANIICDWYNTPINMSGLPTATPVAEAASLTVYAAICPAGYAGGSYFDDCFDNAADAGSVTYTLADAAGNPIDQTVGTDGHARFTSLIGGTYALSDSVPGDALDGRFVYCTFDGANPQTFALDYTENAITLSITAGQEVACDWYILPADLKGEPGPTATATATTVSAPTATPPVSGGGVVGLPNTGSGSVPAAVGRDVGMNGLLGLLAIGFLAGAGMLRQRCVQPAANAANIRTSRTDARRDARQ
jgi:hypothetical protein